MVAKGEGARSRGLPEALAERSLGDRAAIEAFRARLLAWFDAHRRALPWRAEPGQRPDAYAVWVSEVMLQQTRVEVVREYFLRWMERFPTLLALAAASEAEVLATWQGLGYYSRARRLLVGARSLLRDGATSLPSGVDALRAVPGIGAYTAGAIASIAFGAAVPAVDGNVVRVLTRHYALAGDPARTPLAGAIQALAARLVPEGRAGDFNQALMELGATVCTPRRPACFGCPLSETCGALGTGDVQRFPELAARPAPTELAAAALLVTHGGRLLVVRASPSARWWSGLDHLPYRVAQPDQPVPDLCAELLRALGLEGALQVSLAPLRHTITRFRIELAPRVVRVEDPAEAARALAAAAAEPGASLARYVEPGDLAGLALPAPHRRLLRAGAHGERASGQA